MNEEGQRLEKDVAGIMVIKLVCRSTSKLMTYDGLWAVTKKVGSFTFGSPANEILP